MKNQLLRDATDDCIIAVAANMGYTLTAEDCADMRENPLQSFNDDETVSNAVIDYLSAYEG